MNRLEPSLCSDRASRSSFGQSLLAISFSFTCFACEPSSLVAVAGRDGGPWQLPAARPLTDGGPAGDTPADPDGGDLCAQFRCAAWLSAGNLVWARTRHSATLLQDGSVLVVGGEGEEGALSSVERFDPSAGTFMEVGPLQHARYDHAAVALTDGRVLVVGGVQGIERVAEAEVFDPQTQSFQSYGSLAQPRIGHTLTRLADGTVLVVGGLGTDAFATAMEVFDPDEGTFTTVATSTEPRSLHTATLLVDGSVFIAGGMRVMPGVGVEYVGRTERYVPEDGLVSGPMWISARRNHSASRLSSGLVILAGGYTGDALSSVWFFDPVSLVLEPGPQLTQARFAHQTTALDSGAWLLSGGIDDEAIADAEAIDEDGGTGWVLPPMQHARHTHTATRLHDGSVLVVGGTAPGEGITPLSTAERFVLTASQ